MAANKKHDCDVAIIGAGHNGLTCAAYLAGAGLSVRVFERRGLVGGAAVTEEFAPGFRNSTASYTVSLLHPQVIADLDLYANGLTVVERAIANFWPLGDKPGAYLKLSFDGARNAEEFARHSPDDAAALPRYSADIESAADVLREIALETPPNLGGGAGDAWRAIRTANRFRRSPTSRQVLIFDLFTKSAAEFLKSYFSHPAIVAALAFDGVVGNYAATDAPGTAYVLLHHAFGEVNGARGQWGHAVGGMGAITGAMARAAEARGAVIATDAAVAETLIENGRAVGVRLADGRTVRARAVVSNANPKLLARDLLPDDAAPAFRARMDGYACGSGSLRMNVALDAPPAFSCAPDDDGEHLRAGIIIGPSLDYMDRAYFDARTRGWSEAPIVEMLIPSFVDDTLAPAGKHVASLFCQHFAPPPPNGRSWDDDREAAADAAIAAVERFAPGFAERIVARQIHTPLDLERKFGLVGGDIFHGRLSLDQMFSARPTPGAADYRLPVPGLYLCGSGAHPGGGVTGLPGRNAAREIARDFGRRIG
ncbi:MAG: phytoene desaturase family protein [Parvularculaceae bacterium]